MVAERIFFFRLMSVNPSLQRRKGSWNLEAKVEMVRVFEG